jgi:NTP pyrophosphatase (non-canonical NTP hydrolase)
MKDYMSAYQQDVDLWIKENGVRYFNELTNLAILFEEAGELSRLMARKFGEQSFKKELSEAEIDAAIEDEMADIYFVLTCLCNQMNINLNKALQKNFDKKTGRDANRHKSNKKLQ